MKHKNNNNYTKLHLCLNKIILTGKVSNYDELAEAETAAWSVAGVEKVDNKLTIDWWN